MAVKKAVLKFSFVDCTTGIAICSVAISLAISVFALIDIPITITYRTVVMYFLIGIHFPRIGSAIRKIDSRDLLRNLRLVFRFGQAILQTIRSIQLHVEILFSTISVLEDRLYAIGSHSDSAGQYDFLQIDQHSFFAQIPSIHQLVQAILGMNIILGHQRQKIAAFVNALCYGNIPLLSGINSLIKPDPVPILLHFGDDRVHHLLVLVRVADKNIRLISCVSVEVAHLSAVLPLFVCESCTWVRVSTQILSICLYYTIKVPSCQGNPTKTAVDPSGTRPGCRGTVFSVSVFFSHIFAFSRGILKKFSFPP